MENIRAHIHGLVSDSKEYFETKAELWKLKAVDKVSDVASSMIAKTIVMAVLFLFVIMLSIAIALWIGDMLGKAMYGFFIVAGFYGIVGLIMNASRQKLIKTPLNDSLVESMLKHDHEKN